MRPFIILLIFQMICLTCYSQKKPLDHSVYDSWCSIGTTIQSTDGRFVIYQVSPQEGDGKICVYDVEKKSTLNLERAKNAKLSLDSKTLVFEIAPPFKLTRQAKIDKKKEEEMPKDSLGLLYLQTNEILKWARLKSFQTAPLGFKSFAFQCQALPDTSKQKKGGKKEKETGEDLLVFQTATKKADTLKNVVSFTYDLSGEKLALICKPSTKDSMNKAGVYVYLPSTKKMVRVLTGLNKSTFLKPSFSDDGQCLAFYANLDTSKAARKDIGIFTFRFGDTIASVLANKHNPGLPSNWEINSSANLRYGKGNGDLFFETRPILPEKDTTLVEFETAKLDIWSWNADYNPPMDQTRYAREKDRGFTARIPVKGGSMVQLTNENITNLLLPKDWDKEWAFATTRKPYRIQSQWDTNPILDIYRISLKTGEATPFMKGVATEELYLSPKGRYLAWYDAADRNWFAFDATSEQTINLSKALGVPFWNEENDTPSLPGPYGFAGWMDDESAILLNDRTDVWKIDPSGKYHAAMVTEGYGRKNNVVLRIIQPERTKESILREVKGEKSINSRKPVYFSAFDKTTKESGFFVRDLSQRKSSIRKLIVAPYQFQNLQVSGDKKTIYSFQRASFEEMSNMWISSDELKTMAKISDINPQQKNYLWGSAELVKWKTADSIAAEGILFKPENFDPAHKYPMIVYFYEKLSDGLYMGRNPSPSRSTINIPYFVSNGYLVFVPDIYYKVGHPGQSALRSILPGVDMLCKQPWVDQQNMAIQGQSWGGYQVAYMITQTNRFKAAGAGAPVANMTSAYGGVRWGSGAVRQFQYENEQSRIGKSLWDGLELYIENSPLFFMNKVQTPVLIMSNDKDGSVPWYQGIEMFTALRRLGKPAWMLQYNNEDHNLVERRNCKDLSIRLAQFFGYYLKGEPMPKWIRDGIPASLKGIDFGFDTKK